MTTEREELFVLLKRFFNGDEDKMSLWMMTWNPLLGSSPQTMIQAGYYVKLLRWVRQQLADNERDDSQEGRTQ